MQLSIVDLNKTYVLEKRRFSVKDKNFGKKTIICKQALDHVRFDLKEGFYGLLGPNGAGKSTLMKIIAGVLLPDSGYVQWNTCEILKLGKKYRQILGFMPQQQGLYRGFTGRRFLDYMCALKEIPTEIIGDEIFRVAEIVHLLPELDKKLGAYSGGMKQRILLAAALLGDPKLLLLDEPTAGLDPKERVTLRKKLESLAKDRIILSATHVVSDIESVADEILIMKEGRIIEFGNVEALKAKFPNTSGIEDIYLQLFGEER